MSRSINELISNPTALVDFFLAAVDIHPTEKSFASFFGIILYRAEPDMRFRGEIPQ
jgi:hypothetical protein